MNPGPHAVSPRILALAVAVAVATLGGSTGLTAQEVPSPVFGESIEVRVVNIEVIVTDRSGERVTGLTPDAFELLVDGEPVEIEYFSALQDTASAAPAPDNAIEDPPIVVVATAGPSGVRTVPTSVLIFVDDLFAIHARKRLVIKNLIAQLERLDPEDRVAVVAWTGRRLEVRSSWTSSRDRDDVRRILEEAADYPSRGIYPRRSPFDDLEEVLNAGISALRLAGVPAGRKIMLLLAGKWPALPDRKEPIDFFDGAAASVFSANFGLEDFDRLWQTSDSGSPLQPLVDTANSLGYTLYPVFTEGLPASGPGVAGEEADSFIGQASQLSDGALMFLARETGGRFMWAKNRFRALGRALADGRSYYLLGFTPEAGAVERHRIKVRLKDRRLRTRFRRSFVNFDSRMSAHSLLAAGLLSGGSIAAPLGEIELRVLGMRRVRRLTDVEFEMAVPVESLTFLPDAEGNVRASVELSFGVADDTGALSDLTSIPLGFDRPDVVPPGAVVVYRQRITIRPIPHDLMTVVRDTATNKILVGSTRLLPGSTRLLPGSTRLDPARRGRKRTASAASNR